MNPSTLIFTDIALPAVALIGLAFVGLLVFGALNWRQSVDALRSRLVENDRSAPELASVPDTLDTLPPPVARYLRFAVGEGASRPRQAVVASEGEFRRGEAADAWIPFTADQVFTTSKPGFVWDARMRMAPGVAIRVMDAYVEGHGTMRAAVAGLITVVDAPDSPTLATAELMRWLAESPWYPTSLLPGGCVEWSALDDERARATVDDGGVRVSADFRFAPEGQVVEVFVPDRPREVDGSYVPTPWSCRFGTYEERGGMRVPADAVVEWHLPGGELPYWKGRIKEARYVTA